MIYRNTLRIHKSLNYFKNLLKSPSTESGSPHKRLLVSKNMMGSKNLCKVTNYIGQSCKELVNLSDQEVRNWVDSFDTVITDCDGVLWVESQPIPGSPEIIRRFRELGKQVFFVTNNSSKHRREYKAKLDKLGFGGELQEILGSAYLVAAYLEMMKFDRNKLVYVVGSSSITQELQDVGIKCLPLETSNTPHESSGNSDVVREILKEAPVSLDRRVGAVVIGFDTYISFWKILKSASYANVPGVLFLATNTDEQFLMKGTDLVIPCEGAMVAAVATAAGRQPLVLGKPNKFVFEIVQATHSNIQPGRTLMVGDRGDTDIVFGKNCGLQTLLVGSGVHSLQQTRGWEGSQDPGERRMVADFYIESLGDLLDRVRDM